MNKLCRIGVLAGITSLTTPADARYHIWLQEPFFDRSYVDSFLLSHQQMIDSFADRFYSVGPSKEDREKLKQAQENMNKITHDVKEDDAVVTILFKGLTALAKEDVKVVKKETGWFGTITLKEGRIEFFISPTGIQVTSRVELKKDEKSDETKGARSFYTSQSATQADFFSSTVDLQTIKGEVKPTEFILTISKLKEEVLKLS